MKRKLFLGAVLYAVVLVAIVACAPPYTAIDNNTVITQQTNTNVQQSYTAPGGTTRSYAGLTIRDTRTGGADGVSRYGVTISCAAGNAVSGLRGGTWWYDEPSTNWDDWHYRSGIKAECGNSVVDKVIIRNQGDAFKLKADDVRLSRSWIDGSHDDCVQADYGNNGNVIEQSLLQDCYSGISARPSTVIDASGKGLLVTNTIVTVSDKPSCYKPETYGCPNHAGWLKWEKDNPALGLKLLLDHVTFAASSYPEIGSLAMTAPVNSCGSVVLDWTGPTSGTEYTKFLADADTWRAPCPDVVVNVGAAARAHLDGQIAAWHASHDAGLG